MRIYEICMLTCGKTCFVVPGAFISLGYASFSHGTNVRKSTLLKGKCKIKGPAIGKELLSKLNSVGTSFFVRIIECTVEVNLGQKIKNIWQNENACFAVPAPEEQS